jgi:hypothetical protein
MTFKDQKKYLARKRAVFMTFVFKQPNGCWEWTGALMNSGYGKASYRSQQIGAHVLSHILFKGDPRPFQTCHTCDWKPCVNPDHVFKGTQLENEADKVAKGRSEKGSDRYNAKLDEDKVREIRRRAAAGESHAALAKEFGCARPGVSRIVAGKIWKHVK